MGELWMSIWTEVNTEVWMAKIVQSLTRPAKQYDENVAANQVRDLDAVIEKLNTTFQQELKQEIEAKNFFLN